MSSLRSLIALFATPTAKALLASASGFWVCLGGAVLFFRSTGLMNGYLLLAAFVASAVGAGVVLGRIFGRAYANNIGAGAMAALALAWTPVVLVTYGFALAGVPILMAYAYCFVIGARWSGRRRGAAENGPT